MPENRLTVGTVGEAVAALHDGLAARGFNVPDTERVRRFFGPGTREAVKQCQSQSGLEQSGMCDDRLRTLLNLPGVGRSEGAGEVNEHTVASTASRLTSQPFATGLMVPRRAMSGAGADQPQEVTALTAVAAPVGPHRQDVGCGGGRLKPTHLSVFVSERKTGSPIRRVPFYAEVGVTTFLPPPKPVCRLEEAIRQAIQESGPGPLLDYTHAASAGEGAETLVQSLCDALSRLLTQEANDRLASEPDPLGAVIWILQKATALVADKKIDPNAPEALRQLLEEAVRVFAQEHDVPFAGKKGQSPRIVWAHPLGILATDHVGYLSYDLTRLPPDVAGALALALEARRRDPDAKTDTSIWLYPMAREEARIDALEQMRFSPDAIVVKLELDLELAPMLCQPDLCGALKNLGFLSMQNPGLTDWRLSPASFATNPTVLLGDDGCETLYPANVALQEFYFYQVVSLSDVQPTDLPGDVQGMVRLGVAHEYRLAWYPLGHSLGQIQYTLPLAPGESVNLAVIDWTRRDVGRRDEDTKEAEQLVHNQRRDRTITETVNAAIREHQAGSSFMAGLAHAAGATYAAGAWGFAAGLAGSLGGSSSDTNGSRDIAANTIQKLSDNISQASASMRELQSTVVVQTTQHEKEAIETRTVANYNHSHALTILYYEVLRHFRVVTEYVGWRPVVFVSDVNRNVLANVQAEDLSWRKDLLENRAVLEAALLDKRHADGFNALQSIVHRAEVANLPPQPDPVPPPDPGKRAFVYFTFEIGVGGWIANPDDNSTEHPEFTASLLDKGRFIVQLRLYPNNAVLNPRGSFGIPGQTNIFTASLPRNPPDEDWPQGIAWEVFDCIAIGVTPFGMHKLSLTGIKVTARDTDGKIQDLVSQDYGNGHLGISQGYIVVLPVSRPVLPPTPIRPTENIEDDVKLDELIHHLQYYRAHYSRALYLNKNSAERAEYLDGFPLLDKVENRPLEIMGHWVAFPCSDSRWATNIRDAINRRPALLKNLDERLVTLPTRGLFAEAKLGHCNASEEIDNTRFWKWEEHPIPHMAPEIAPIQAVTPQPQQPTLAPTPFPQSLLNIVNPPAAPDPTGLAAALKVLGTPDIFRDMSGRTEVADLLKKLSDNSISIADAANKAKEIQNKYGVDLDKQQKEFELGKYQAATDLIGKAIDAEAKGTAAANARKDEANATKAEVEAGKAQADSAKEVPKSKREPIYQAAANTIAGNPTKTKTVVFKTVGFNNQNIDGFFKLAVRDVVARKDVIFEQKISGPYWDTSVTFDSPEPVLEAKVERPDPVHVTIFGDTVIDLPSISIVSKTQSYSVGKSHRAINITLKQESREVNFKATTTDGAVDELMNKWGGELGVNKVVAAKLVGEYEKKNSITHTKGEEKSYSFNVPTQNYDLVIASN